MTTTKNDYRTPILIEANAPTGELSLQIVASTINGQPSPNKLCLLLEPDGGQPVPILFSKSQAIELTKQLQRLAQVL